jgi:GntR family transcriptional regulator
MISFHDRSPVYQQIIEYLEELILEQRIVDSLPSVRSLSVDMRVNPQTILKAMQDLVQRGIIEKHRGTGMFLTPNGLMALKDQKRDAFLSDTIPHIVQEAELLGITSKELLKHIEKTMKEENS